MTYLNAIGEIIDTIAQREEDAIMEKDILTAADSTQGQPMRGPQRFQAAVTMEYETQAPETWRGEIVVPNARLGARRALEAAQKAYPNRKWSSVVILLTR